MSQPIKLARR